MGGIPEDVVATVADRKDVSEDALPPLYETIDSDVLEALFENGTKSSDTGLVVQFSYAGYRVTIQEPGDVSLDE